MADELHHPHDEALDLTELSLEELMDIEVTSVSKKEQKLSEAAAAVFVITQEDIRRSGATSIPEVLRMVPGLQVARIDSNKWAITSRGFNSRFANKLLVLIDGRSVYTPLFSGVYWDVQDTLLEDIDHIEVIRGPGGSLWGANAVNGVINIITKKAGDTQGGLISAGGGSEEKGFGSLRYGTRFGDDISLRVYTKYFNRDDLEDASNEDGSDEWHTLRGGFRIDWERSEKDSLTLQGDVYDGETGSKITTTSLTPSFISLNSEDEDISGGNFFTRWTHIISDTSDMTFQIYYDRTERKGLVLEEIRDTFDLDFQHKFRMGQWQEIIWGLGYRFTQDDIHNNFTISFYPDKRDDSLFSAFIHDEITIVSDRLRLSLGSKFEHNDYTSVEIQPNARLLWTPYDEHHSLWAAVSHAVKTPSRSHDDIRINFAALPDPFGSKTLLSIYGDRGVESEKVVAYEVGYRLIPIENLYIDIAAFFNDYEDLLTQENGRPFFETSSSPSHLVFPFFFDNKMDGHTYGIEMFANWQPLKWWRLAASYSYLQIQLHRDGASTDRVTEEVIEGSSPHNQFSVRSLMNLSKNIELDFWGRYVENLPALDVESYVTLDARLSWKPIKNHEVSLMFQNLYESRHPEFISSNSDIQTTQVERGVYGKITWQF